MKFKRQNKRRCIWPIVVFFCLMGGFVAKTSAQMKLTKSTPEACRAKYKSDEAIVGAFTFRIYERGMDAYPCLQILQDGRVIYRRIPVARSFSLGQKAQPGYSILAVANGTDLTGRGHPDMVVTIDSGGAHCCVDLLLFELGPKLRLLTTLHLYDYDLGHFEKDVGDAQYHFVGYDEAFVYWHTSLAESPGTRVILRWVAGNAGHGSYRIALDEMRWNQPSEKEWQEDFLERAREAFEANAAFADTPDHPYFVGSGLWKAMLELIFTGRSPLAWKLLDQVWPTKKAGKAQFLSDFCSQLSGDLYWQDLQPTIENAPPPCKVIFAESTKMKK